MFSGSYRTAFRYENVDLAATWVYELKKEYEIIECEVMLYHNHFLDNDSFD